MGPEGLEDADNPDDLITLHTLVKFDDSKVTKLAAVLVTSAHAQ